MVANAAGQRARFLESDEPRFVTLTDNVTLGTLQIDSDQNHTFQDDGQGIQFVGTGGNAVIEVRDTFFFNANRIVGAPTERNNPSHTMNVDMDLVSSLDLLQNLELSQVTLAGQITGTEALNKLGRGLTLLTNETNRYSGGTFVLEGILAANATGTLGTADAVVSQFGQLDYNAKNAVAPDKAVIVEANGTLNLGIVPDATEHMDVRGFGAIRGNAAELQALTLDGNLKLLENAMIVHEGAGEGTPSGLGNSPKYLYGIGGDFTGVVPQFGTQSTGPWKGFGAGNGNAVLGTPAGGSAAERGRGCVSRGAGQRATGGEHTAERLGECAADQDRAGDAVDQQSSERLYGADERGAGVIGSEWNPQGQRGRARGCGTRWQGNDRGVGGGGGCWSPVAGGCRRGWCAEAGGADAVEGIDPGF